MNTLTILIAVAVMAAAALWLVFRRSRRDIRPKHLLQASSASNSGSRTSTQWRAVKIAPGLICCDAAEKMSGQVYLSTESPRLPLDGCDETDCRCKYVHMDDRRSGDDRRIELGDLGAFLPTNQVERRKRSGRRASDLAA
jgi:hypothetical protein